MSYLEEIQKQIDKRDLSKILVLWEEYCANDRVDPKEFLQILQRLKKSDFREQFGTKMEEALPLWTLIEDENDSFQVLRLIIDLQTTNSPLLAEKALEMLKKRFQDDPYFEDRLRQVGLRTKQNFQGALSYFQLLHHMEPGNVVYHEGGWGTGEIMDVSLLREHMIIEFENLSGKKDLSFAKAFKSLVPLPTEHFLSRRFVDPDNLEEEAKKDPIGVIKLLLTDLGPLTAGEIKDEMCELVIPEKEWTRWWQGARSRLKKDPFIESPKTLKQPFRLRKEKMTQEERVENALEGKTEVQEKIAAVYQIVRDQPNTLKNAEIAENLRDNLLETLQDKETRTGQKLQILLLLENFFQTPVEGFSMEQIVQEIQDIETTVKNVEILSFKKQILQLIQKHRSDWKDHFLSLLFAIPQGMIKDLLFQELEKSDAKEALVNQLEELAHHPKRSPETLYWYFQKLFQGKKKELPFNDPEGRILFLEAFMILYSQIEWEDQYRDLLKKMYLILSANRYLFVRNMLKEMTLAYAKEFLLLASKCQTLSNQDQQVFRSLTEVAHPSLKSRAGKESHLRSHENVLWTTEEGYMRTQEEIQKIGTVEIVENAKEIEAARQLGDLRENSEYKYALERRSWLQGQLRRLSHQLHQARILTPPDIHADQVDVGTVVEIVDLNGKALRYTILGPWDANTDKNILSFQSKFAEAMLGCKKGERFSFRDDSYEVVSITSFFDEKV